MKKNNERRIDRVISALKESGKKELDLRKLLNVESQNWNNWKKRDIPNKEAPSVAKALSELTGTIITTDWLLTGNDYIEVEVIRPNLPAPLPENAIYELDTVDYNVRPGPKIHRRIPLISSVSAGRWCEAIDNYSTNDAEDWFYCSTPCSKHTYALRVDGDSMTSPYGKSYPHGSIIFVDPCVPIFNGCRVIAKLPNVEQAIFKQYNEDSGRRFLKALNPAYPIIEIFDDTRLCGVIIGKYEPE